MCLKDIKKEKVIEDPKFYEKLAKGYHKFYQKKGKEESSDNRSWEQLPPNIKADNIAAAKRLIRNLSLIGFQVVDKHDERKEAPEYEVNKAIKKFESFLAEEEHKGWMETKLQNGWRYGEKRDDSKKIHPCLRPFKELPEKEKMKDIYQIYNYPKIVKEAGLKIVNTGEVSPVLAQT